MASKAHVRLRSLMSATSTAICVLVGRLEVCSHRLTTKTLWNRCRQLLLVLIDLLGTIAIVVLVDARVSWAVRKWLGSSAGLNWSLRHTRSLE